MIGVAIAVLTLLVVDPQQNAKPADVGSQRQPPTSGTPKPNVGTPKPNVAAVPNQLLTKQAKGYSGAKAHASGHPTNPTNPWSRSDIIQAVTAAATCLYLAATVGILIATRKANRQAKDAYEQSSRDVARSLHLTTQAVKVAADQLTAITRIARAQVDIVDIGTINIFYQPRVLNFNVVNRGYSPGLNIQTLVKFGISADDSIADELAKPQDDEPWSSPFALLAGVSKPSEVEFTLIFTEDERAALREREANVYIWGKVTYRDIFKDRRWTEFWARYDVGPNRWMIGKEESD